MPDIDSVSNPVRLAIVRRLEGGVTATLEQLAAAAGVHRNTARSHAEVLERAGVIERAEGARGKGAGRPRTQFRLTEPAMATDPPQLAELLGTALSESGLSQKQARRIGRLRAAALGRLVPKRRRAGELETELMELGFRARVSDDRIELDRCPCPLVSTKNPALACALITGTVDGTLDRMGSSERVVDADHDPVARRCTLRLGEPEAKR